MNWVRTHTNPKKEVYRSCVEPGSFGARQMQNDALYDERDEGVEKEDGDEDPGTAHCPMNGWQYRVRNLFNLALKAGILREHALERSNISNIHGIGRHHVVDLCGSEH